MVPRKLCPAIAGPRDRESFAALAPDFDCGVVSLTFGQSAGEYQVKVAFLVNFAKFVEWPTSNFSLPTEPIDICVLGADPFDQALDSMVKNKLVSGRILRTRYSQEVSQTKGCEIVFVDAVEAQRSWQFVREVKWGVLTVGESKDFAREGGIVNFIVSRTT